MGMYTYTPFEETEVEPYPNKSLSESFMFKFNNFFCHFVIKPEDGSLGAYRESFYEESGGGHILKFPDLTSNRETRIRVNRFQFYKDLDSAVIESGSTNEKIRELIHSWQKSRLDDENTELLFKALAPIYKGMRNKGYLVLNLWS